MKELFEEINEWGDKIFLDEDIVDIAIKLEEEAGELKDSCQILWDEREAKKELMDCLIMCFRGSRKLNMSYEDVLIELKNKFEHSKTRTFVKNEQGIYKGSK